MYCYCSDAARDFSWLVRHAEFLIKISIRPDGKTPHEVLPRVYYDSGICMIGEEVMLKFDHVDVLQLKFTNNWMFQKVQKDKKEAKVEVIPGSALSAEQKVADAAKLVTRGDADVEIGQPPAGVSDDEDFSGCYLCCPGRGAELSAYEPAKSSIGPSSSSEERRVDGLDRDIMRRRVSAIFHVVNVRGDAMFVTEFPQPSAVLAVDEKM